MFAVVLTWVGTALAMLVLLLMALSELMPEMLDRFSPRGDNRR